ncbi:hypothetical protein WCU73_19975, partial [Pectobacterium brasiliense]
YFSCVTAPIISGEKANMKRGQQIEKLTARLIRARAKCMSNNPFSFLYQMHTKASAAIFLFPKNDHCSSSSQIRVRSP